MKFYTAQEIADEIGIHVSSVYSWEKKGLLVPAKKTPTGRRFYSEDQMQVIRNNDFENPILKGCGVLKYKLEDLKIGMFIEDWHELEDIYGVYIYLDGYRFNDLKGEILYMCKEPDAFVDNLSKERGGLCCYYKPIEVYLDFTEMEELADE